MKVPPQQQPLRLIPNTQALWDDADTASASLGCWTCVDRGTCGGAHKGASFFDCNDYCYCADSASCDLVCRGNPAAFVVSLTRLAVSMTPETSTEPAMSPTAPSASTVPPFSTKAPEVARERSPPAERLDRILVVESAVSLNRFLPARPDEEEDAVSSALVMSIPPFANSDMSPPAASVEPVMARLSPACTAMSPPATSEAPILVTLEDVLAP